MGPKLWETAIKYDKKCSELIENAKADRLIELAIKGLEVEKARIEEELADLRNQ